jgi:hypothetical protein
MIYPECREVVQMPTKKTTKSKASTSSGETHAMAEAISAIAEELRPIHQIENLADHTASLASEVGFLARAHTLSAIAQFGNTQDKEWALKHLKMLVEDR